ncbi:dynein heavy chain 1, axonemal-like [Centruroides sculpturatus]|uniref:dynein heavy chain 1, axonemal-like n=1 Tax=Centruroides sculpturatus TaxID=218467 RepID=UPI000C6DB6F4|nr:dynein heavy chain 1, axonemal-like [Centruroides sculpturatus]
MFDDNEFDCRTPQEWLSLGRIDNDTYLVPGIAFLKASKDKESDYQWVEVAVCNYNPVTSCFLVKKISEINKVELIGEYWIPRIYLMFLAENPKIFVKRILAALKLRRETEFHLRYNFYINQMFTQNLPILDSQSIEIILNKAVKNYSQYQMFISEVTQDIISNYHHTFNELTFREVIPKYPDIFSNINIPEKKKMKISEKGYEYDGIVMFEELRFQFCNHTFMTKKEIVLALVGIILELIKIEDMRLYKLKRIEASRLEEFVKTQEESVKYVSMNVHKTLTEDLCRVIRSGLRECNKGWYNIYENDWHIYENSKMKKFMIQVHYRMQDSLRFMVEKGLSSFSQLIVELCKPAMDLNDEYIWENDLSSSIFK